MNIQDAFNQAYTGLKTQGQLAYQGLGCFFYNPQAPNLTCAVGQMLPDTESRERVEYSGIGGVAHLDEQPEKFSIFQIEMEKSGLFVTEDDLAFLEAVQNAHDNAAVNETGIDGALCSLEQVAERFDLTVPQ